MHTLAELLSGVNRSQEAIALAQKTLELRRAILPESHPHISSSLYILARCYAANKQWSEAEEVNQQLCERIKNAEKLDKAILHRALNQKKEIYLALSRPADEIDAELQQLNDKPPIN